MPVRQHLVVCHLFAWFYKLSVFTSKDLISKDVTVVRVSRLGHMEEEGGTVDYETSVNRMARPATSFCEMKVDLCSLHL